MDIFEQPGLNETVAEVASPPTLVFSKGGKLTMNEWIYDHNAKIGHYQHIDLTEDLRWIHKRGRDVQFADDVTLNDVFLFLERDPEICDMIFENCYIKDYVNCWKKIDPSTINRDHSYDPDGIEYLMVYWATDLFTYAGKQEISGLDRACFDGQGFELQEDQFEDEEKTYKLYSKGTRIDWGIDFTPLPKMLDLPVVLNTEFKILKEWGRRVGIDYNKDEPPILDCYRSFSFHQAIEAIMWELSFHGIEEDKLAKGAELSEIRKSIDWDSLK
jgi:hypothetical protein